MDEVKDKKIYFDATKPGNWCTTHDANGNLGEDSRIFATDRYLIEYEATVENIVSSLICHEWFSHKIQCCSDKTKNHQQAYMNTINGPYWDKTTDAYKNAQQKKFNDYHGR